MSEGIEVLRDYGVTELPTAQDNVERVVRYGLIGRPDFARSDFDNESRPKTWAPWDLTIRYQRSTRYQGGHVVERTEWRLTNVRMHAWLRLKSGATSDKVDRLFDFADLPHEYERGIETWWKELTSSDFPYVREMIDACAPQAGELC